MKKNEELTVITKTYDLIVWTVNHTSRFPRNHRHVLGLRIEQHLVSWLGHAKQGSGDLWRKALFARIRFQKGDGR